MPGMTGIELHNLLKERGYSISTMYPDEIIRARAVRDGVKYYLRKPLAESPLRDSMSSALGDSVL